MQSLVSQLQSGDFEIIGEFTKGFIIFKVQNFIYAADQHAVHERLRLEMLESDYRKNDYKPSRLKKDVLDVQLVEELRATRIFDLYALKTRACKGAIKITDQISREQMREMLQTLGTLQFPFICAHGRPSIVQLIDLHKTVHQI
jgi:DNA mismatch repair ATPase MutL